MGEPTGIIYPPPELKGTVDSTAKYVAKNGGAFEERLKRDHRDKPKFSFLFPEDPFNAYYKHKVREIRNTLLGSLESNADQGHQEIQEQHKSHQSQSGRASDHEPTSEGEPSRKRLRDGDIAKEEGEDDRDDDSDSEQLRQEEHGSQSEPIKNQDLENDHGRQPSEGDANFNEAHKTIMSLDDYIQEMTMKLEEPPSLNFLATPAPSLTQMGSDIIKLTSQYIASYGRSFLLELVSREQSNPLFDFLKPQHGQFSYMLNLIMQYALAQNSPLDILDLLHEDSTSLKHVVNKVKMRAEWNRVLEIDRRKQEAELEKDKLLYSQIDWHDFVIVETIDYQPDEKGEYPPTTADQVGTRLLIQQRFEEQSAPEEMDIEDMDASD